MTGDEPRRAAAAVNAVTVAAATLFWLVSTSWRPWDLFERAGFSADFHDEQARALLHGHLDVDPFVASIEGFVVDGRTYLYYGPFLAVVRMPFQLLGDLTTGRLVRVSMLIAVVVVCRWSARILRAARSLVAGGASTAGARSEAWAAGLFTAAVALSPMLAGAGWISVYNETELWAFALALVGATSLLEWLAEGCSATRPLVIAVLAALAATLTRAPVGLGVALAIGATGAVLAWRSRAEGFRAGRLALLGGVLPLAAHAAVNAAKFGTLLSVPGGRQQLSLDDPERAAWFAGNGGSFFSTDFLSTTLVHYLRPDAIRFERLLPGIRFGPVAESRGSYPLLGSSPATSLTLAATLLLVLAVVGTVWSLRHGARAWGLVVLCTTIGAVPTFLIGFVANRYLIDMLPPLVVAGAVGTWVVDAWAGRGVRGRVLRGGAVVLVVWSAWVNGSLATWGLEQRSAGFTDLRYRVDGWLFSDPPPGLVGIEPGEPVARDGVVGVHRDAEVGCTGVYTAEQGTWFAVERSSARVVRRAIEPDRIPSPVVAGTTWRVDLDVEGPGKARVVTSDGRGQVVSEQPLERWARQQDEDRVELQVVADPVTGEYTVVVGDEAHFLPRSLVSTSPITVPRGDDVSDLCERLERRL